MRWWWWKTKWGLPTRIKFFTKWCINHFFHFWANLKKSSKTTKQRFLSAYISQFWATYRKARQSLKKRVEINLLHAKSTDFQKLSTSGQTEIQQTHVQKSQWKRYNHLRKRRQLQMRSKSCNVLILIVHFR